MTQTIDLRSDTVTLPTARMREAMAHAEVGDDVYGDDPTVNALQEKLAELTGTEVALLFPSGTQANLCALLSHCQRGEEYVCGQTFHNYKYEAGGGAVLGGIQPQPLEIESDGSLDLERVARAIKSDDCHFAKTRLLCLENTIGGRVLGLDYMERATAFARSKGLSVHLDGARLFNALHELGVSADRAVPLFDTVSVCLSKGLAAPAGSLLCGKTEWIERARRWRKMAGGGMRQAGIIAAAGIVALEDVLPKIGEDHRKASLFATLLGEKSGMEVENHTNMVFVDLDEASVGNVRRILLQNSVKATVGVRTRFVFHKDIAWESIEKVAGLVAAGIAENGVSS